MSVTLLWYGIQATKMVRGKVGKRISKATDYLHRTVRKSVSIPFPPASAEGQYPHVRTGKFHASIQKEYDKKKLEGRVGSNLGYAKDLEIGTPMLAPRPWLSLLVKEEQDKLKGIVLGVTS